jgi:hypothetical protein
MPRYKVGGQLSFITEVRAKNPIEAEQKGLRKAWREGSCYLDVSSVQRIVKRDGEDVELPDGE